MAVTEELTGPAEADAGLIEQSWAEPERFAAIFERYFTQIHLYLARRAGGKIAPEVLRAPRRAVTARGAGRPP